MTKKTKNGASVDTSTTAAPTTPRGHPRVRVTEADIDRQVLAVFDKMRVEDERVRDWFRVVLASQTRDAQADSLAQRAELQRQETLLVAQQDRLLNMRLAEDIDQETFARKHTELRDRLASIKLQLDVLDRSHDETAELAAKVFELSQTLQKQWLTADYAAKRRILEIVCLNCRLDGVTLVPTMRKPFDVLAEGLLSRKVGATGFEPATSWSRTSALARLSYAPWSDRSIARSESVGDVPRRDGETRRPPEDRADDAACFRTESWVLSPGS